ncbi:MAG: site-specific DNA-methyltransferase, partial [Thermodesulfovibrio sp.]|nr:site-specific DNA-methyltransferase [Thermodesulfovibrio sp.]
EALDGWLIKSENYQTLKTILPKFKSKVQTIYIDPPFNKEQDADYHYSVKYKDATWITLLENRLRLARELLKDTGSIFVRCDYNGNMFVRLLMNEIFGEENFRNEIVVGRTKKIFLGVRGFNVAIDSILFFSKSEDFLFNHIYKKRDTKQKWLNMHSPGERRPPERVIFGVTYYPPKGRHWTFTQETIDRLVQEGRVRINERIQYVDMLGNPVKGMPQYLLSNEELLDSNWSDISGYSFNWHLPTENSEALLKRVIQSISNEGDIVMDFFLGSGTTCAVAHKLKRKWIGVEMGEHFWTVALPRMKKVLAYDNLGISKEKDVEEKYNENKAGGFFKYYELEQYEETLANTIYEDCGVSSEDIFTFKSKTLYEQYAFMKDEKMLKTLEIDYENNKIKVDLNKIYENIDIAETLSNLTGKWIKQIKDGKVIFEDGSVVDTKSLDYKLIKPLIWWE